MQKGIVKDVKNVQLTTVYLVLIILVMFVTLFMKFRMEFVFVLKELKNKMGNVYVPMATKLQLMVDLVFVMKVSLFLVEFVKDVMTNVKPVKILLLIVYFVNTGMK